MRDNSSSDEEPPKRQACKKVKTTEKVDEEEGVEQEEVAIEVVDSEESGNKPKDEHQGSAQKNNEVCIK